MISYSNLIILSVPGDVNLLAEDLIVLFGAAPLQLLIELAGLESVNLNVTPTASKLMESLI